MKIFHNIFTKTINIFVNLIIIILVIIAIFSVYGFTQINILNKEYIDIFGYTFFKTETASMEKTILIGDIVIVKIGEEFSENDIITYKDQNVFVTHRVIKKEEDTIITKGDNNNSEDEPISKNEVLGKVVFIAKNVELWKKVFTDKRVFIPLIISITLLAILIFYQEDRSNKCSKEKEQ